VLVTDVMPSGYDVLACGPQPMLEAVRAREPSAQLAWEAPMACGFGACFGCVVELAGSFKRLCVEGPVLAAHAARTSSRRSVAVGATNALVGQDEGA
jgi:NAD(P)H-flavin reductase